MRECIYGDSHEGCGAYMYRRAEQYVAAKDNHTRLFTFLSYRYAMCAAYTDHAAHILSRTNVAHRAYITPAGEMWDAVGEMPRRRCHPRDYIFT